MSERQLDRVRGAMGLLAGPPPAHDRPFVGVESDVPVAEEPDSLEG